MAKRLEFTVVGASDLRGGIHELRQRGAFGVVVVSTAAVGFAEDGHSAEAFTVLRPLIRCAGQAQFVILAHQPLSMEACSEIIRLGVAGILDAADEKLDEAALVHRLGHARERFRSARTEGIELNGLHSVAGDSLVWRSRAMDEVIARAARAAQVSDVPVLIFGESGTGKQLLAELIHQLDPKRSHQRLLSVNCSAISGTLAESMLFGHVKGAFTGALGPRKGIFRAADGGTVLLDEIGEMDLALQPKLLRVLQQGVVMPVGSDDEIPIDVRVIAATNRRLAANVEESKFRLDLYQRLNVIGLEIPPLRERPEDIPVLIRFFLRRYADYYERPIDTVEPQVYEYLAGCTLQGNVRELENVVRQTLAFKTSGTTLTLDDVPPALVRGQRRNGTDSRMILTELAHAACRLVDTGAMTLPQLMSMCEKMVLRNTLANSQATSSDVARQLGLSRRTLYNKIRKYRLPAPRSISTEEDSSQSRP